MRRSAEVRNNAKGQIGYVQNRKFSREVQQPHNEARRLNSRVDYLSPVTALRISEGVQDRRRPARNFGKATRSSRGLLDCDRKTRRRVGRI